MEVTKDMFEKVPKEERQSLNIMRPSETFLKDSYRRLKKNKLVITVSISFKTTPLISPPLALLSIVLIKLYLKLFIK